MEDGPDSGYPSPRDGIPQTSTPIRPGAKPSLNEHFSYENDPYIPFFRGFDTTLEFGNGSHAESSSTEIPKSKPSHTKADGEVSSVCCLLSVVLKIAFCSLFFVLVACIKLFIFRRNPECHQCRAR